MWFMPTRGRPEKCQDVLNACVQTNMEEILLVVVDGGSYKDSLLPPAGVFYQELPEQLELGGVLNWCFKTYPKAPFYGFISDDTVPRTQGWDTELAESAKLYGIASSNDLWKGGSRMSGALCFNGDLLRSWGWWSLPGLVHLYIDDVWELLVPNWKYREDVVVEHLHFGNKKAKKDSTYTRVYRGQNYAASDRRIFEEWKNALR